MIIGHALRQWLDDAAGQTATLAAVRQSGRSFAESPAMRVLEREVEAASDAEQILAAARRLIESDGLVEGLVGQLIAASREDPFHCPPFRSISDPLHVGLLLVETPKLTIVLGITRPDGMADKRRNRQEAGSINFDGQHTLYRFLKAGGGGLSFWEAPGVDASFTSDTSGRCRCVARRPIEEGEVITLDGATQTFIIEEARSDIVYLKAATPAGAAPLAIHYDSETLGFAGASGGDDKSARLQMIASLLRITGHDEAAPRIEEMLAHPHFYVRWHAMRELLAVDAERALPSLRAMASSDPHPEVRAAAAATLEAFFSDEISGEEEAERCPA